MADSPISQEIVRWSEAFLRGEKGAIGRALNLAEDARAGAGHELEALSALLAAVDRGRVVGITGTPGVGKSSLLAKLVAHLRSKGDRVAVIAIDPSSVRSGGSILGDRARMNFDPADTGIFVRSIATHGVSGGMAREVPSMVQLLRSAFDWVFVETTGVGQNEVDVVYICDTLVLVLQPGAGDMLQFVKAGIMEVPDVFVTNKADLEAIAKQTTADITRALSSLRSAGIDSHAEIAMTSAQTGAGIPELADILTARRNRENRARRISGLTELALRRLVEDIGELGLIRLGGRDVVRSELQATLETGCLVRTAVDRLARKRVESSSD